MTEILNSYYTNPSQRRPCTDHVPILTMFNFPTTNTLSHQTHNYSDIDWKAFIKILKSKLINLPTHKPIILERNFQETTEQVTTTNQDTIKAHVPLSWPSPHIKRWWNQELTIKQQEVHKLANLSYRWWHYPQHSCHEEYRAKCNLYSKAIKATKWKHWKKWLEHMESEDIYSR